MASFKTLSNPVFSMADDNTLRPRNFNELASDQSASRAIGEALNSNNTIALANNAAIDPALFNLSFNWTDEKISEPVYTKGNDTFGVISHIDPFSSQFQNAKRGILDLRNEIQPSEGSLIQKIATYIENLYAAHDANTDELDRFFSSYYNGEQFVYPRLATIVNPGDAVAVDDNTASRTENDQSALFASGRVMRDDIRITQQLRTAIVRFRKFQQKKMKHLQDKLTSVSAEIVPAHKTLANLHRKRLESASDYQVAKQLVAEDWEKVEANYRSRAHILNNHQGIYFARVRETAVNASPPSPLPLRFSSAKDLVPGCPLEDKDLPEELEPFMESILDIAIGDWRELRPHYRLLPARRRLDAMLMRRKARLDYRLNAEDLGQSSLLSLRMSRLYVNNKTLLREMSRQPFVAAPSLAKHQWASAQSISLEDLLNGPPHRLRAHAENLRNKLDQASHCILQELRHIRPSIRLEWAAAAEADSLAIDTPSQWPGLDRAEKDDLNGLRTMIELVQWWFRQLSPQASSTAYSAVRNLMRACLLIAASDDPEDILHGHLQTVPGRLKLGDALRVSLNREALPGTRLQLLDNNSRLVGTLTVEDHDTEGAVATLTQLHDASALPASSFTVSGFSLPGQQRQW